MKKFPQSLSANTLLLIVLLGSLFICPAKSRAQAKTVLSGVITDAKTKETLPGVSVGIASTTQGTSADNTGHYRFGFSGSARQVTFSYVGYKSQIINVIPGHSQVVDISLATDNKQLAEVSISAGKKAKYRNKGNPAVELIREVIAHKSQNRLENYDYAEYHQYERMAFSLSDLSEKFKSKGIFKNYQFLFRQQDSTEMGGKILLPVYMEEKLSANYFRRAPYVKKQVIEASKQVKYDENYVDNEGLTSYFNRMYQDIEIYDNNIGLLGNQLLSPIADGAPSFYKFFITDTIKDVSPQLIELSFTPRSTTDMLFEGRIYITMDGRYAVQQAVLTVNKNINLNFVRALQATLSFEKNSEGRYQLDKSDLKIDFGLSKKKGGGIFGERLVDRSQFLVNVPRPAEFYAGPALMIASNAKEKGDDFWKVNRPDTLKAAQDHIYSDIDSLQNIPSFKRTLNIATLVLAGYRNYGPFEVGPINTFYNFNPVEGFRLRLGGRTTTALSKRYYAETYGAYGFKDEKFKYFLSGTYSLNDKSIYSFPQEYLRASFQHDTKIPGQELQFVQEDNFLLSFKRGQNDIMLYNDILRLDYMHEYLNHFSYKVELKQWEQHPAGALLFKNTVAGSLNDVNGIRVTELGTELRYAPKEKFYQGKLYRTPIPDKYPVFTLRYQQGFKGLLGGEHTYENITGNITKRFYLSQLGYTDFSTEGGYVFGKLPFPLLDIHHANQSYALQLQSYNLMNFLEFVSDHYAAVNIDQNFNGFIFNKIPVLRDLKLREIVSFKALWGGIRSQNNPANEASLLKFPTNGQGVPRTYSLNDGPYMEGSIGIGNIFKVLRLDMVERFTYLDHPEAPKYGLRALVVVQF